MSATASRWRLLFVPQGRSLVLAVPWFWLLLFFAVPFVILLRISVTDMGEGLDPFAPLAELRDGHLMLHLKFRIGNNRNRAAVSVRAGNSFAGRIEVHESGRMRLRHGRCGRQHK